MTKRNSAASVTQDGRKWIFDWADGQRDVFNADAMSDEQRERAMMHGFGQKLRDAYALPTKEVEGRMHRPTLDEKRAAMRDVLAVLNAGGWNAERGSGESGTMLYRAVREHFTAATGTVPSRVATPDAFREWVESQALALKTTKRKVEDQLRKNPRIAAILERLQRESGAPVIDSDSLLDGLADV